MASELPVVHQNKLSEIYADAGAQAPRYRGLLERFAEVYGAESSSPDLIVRSPGRVNIIGDHIDYALFDVLPMAVESDMIMVASLTNELKVEVANTNSGEFPSGEYAIAADGSPVAIDATKSDWINYFKCGHVVGSAFLKSKGLPVTKGIKVLIDGNVPTGSGLSSSAAFVVCSTLVTLLANGYKSITKKQLTELSIKCEQLVGVNSGGMDQSASVFGLKGHALFVSFLPELRVKPFAFPDVSPKLNFVVANSLITSNKHETGPVNYNLRVVEVTLGALLMAKKLGLTIRPDGNLAAGTFRGVLDAYFADDAKPYGTDLEADRSKLDRMLALVKDIFKHWDEGYTTEEIAAELGETPESLTHKYMTAYPVRYETLQLYRRAYHVYAESKRVLDFLALLESPPAQSADLFAGLGQLMNESHSSAQKLFNNSNKELDDICAIALAHGAAGSRVTGAGWGGSSVHLVPADKTQAVIEALTEQYYKKRFHGITQEQINDALLVSEPGSGTTIIDNLSLD
ncbi:protein Gal3p [Trichomonascus vanleenenianus]|uniref:protein Gal3p n=1 Tax=Trichomonascus vanleenenianus TaxID=2268995 RepID=UPI003EC9D00B